MSRLILTTVALLGTGCVFQGAPIPVLGDSKQLEGEWAGAYESPQSGRSGSILFHFGGVADSAFGDVVMTPARTEEVGPATFSTRVLRISFVWCGEQEVTGRLDPYNDPVTGETIYTMFEGRLQGNRLVGTFSTLYPDRSRLLIGTWSARRKK